MDIRSLRKELGFSLDAFADAVGLKSRSAVHDLETGRSSPSVPVALAIERLSGARIKAHALNRDVALVRSANDTQSKAEAA
jgi:transcriptional regulator with XRE-family HTH domain